MGNDTNNIDKLEYLKQKCNKQVDYINELRNEIKSKDEIINRYSKNKDNNCTDNSIQIMDKFDIVIQTLKFTITELIKNDYLIEGKQDNILNANFSIVKSKILKEIIANFTTELSVDKIIKIWAELNIVYTNEDKGAVFFNYTYKGSSIRCLRISKKYIRLVKDTLF